MEPIAVAAVVAIAAAMVASLVAGAVIGAVVWRLKYGLALGGLCVGLYLLVAPGRLVAAFLSTAWVSAPPLVMTFLTSYLTARHLSVRTKWRPAWATVAALAGALALGALYMSLSGILFRRGLWDPAWIAIGADLSLALLVIRDWSAAPP
jgi:hypothetical protein